MSKVNILSYTNFIVCAFLVLMISCKHDAAPVPQVLKSEFVGEWRMAEAYKNEAETKLLDNAYFKFTETGLISTNLLGNESPVSYEYSNGKLIMGNGITYIVESKTADTLIMSTKMRNFDFKFITIKVAPEI